MSRKKTFSLVVLLLIVAFIGGLAIRNEILVRRWRREWRERTDLKRMSLGAGLMYLSSTTQPSLKDVEEAFSLNAPITLKPPTETAPVWWFVYHYQEKVLELGVFYDDEPALTIENRLRETVEYTGFFKLRTPEAAALDDGSSTYKVPTYGGSLSNRYADFLNAYDMRTPISIREVELAMDLPQQPWIEFLPPLWYFFYSTQDSCMIRLYGVDRRAKDAPEVDPLFVPREQFLFTGYWVVGCWAPEPTPLPTPDTFVQRVKTWIFGKGIEENNDVND